MNANDILIDLLEDNKRRLHRLFAEMDDACLYWKPHPEANSIAITVWHMARIFDVFLTQHAEWKQAEAECWFSHNWVEKTGYDPRGIGQNGWGMLTGYTQEEAAAVPHLTRQQLLQYLDEVYTAVREYLTRTSIETMQEKAAGFEGKFTRYQCIQMALLDNVRHLGEIFALKTSWDRFLRAAQ